jgi:hypothetical protein
MQPKPHPAVLAWVAAQPRATLYTTSINLTEILYGIAMLPAGRRRTALAAAAEAIFAEDLAGRVLPCDGAGPPGMPRSWLPAAGSATRPRHLTR